MKFYLNKTPRSIQSLYKKFTWRFKTEKKELYLTFDDGPIPEITPWVLKQLKKYQAKATFFCIGKNIKNHPEICKQLIQEGHTIGNHTYNHLNGWKNTIPEYLSNIEKAENAISTTLNSLNCSIQHTKLFRPPYGKIKASQTKNLQKKGYTIILWDVLSADFDTTISSETCLKNVLKNTENGSIIVFHDSEKAKEKLFYALPKVLEYYSKKGYTFKKITSISKNKNL